MKFGSRVLKGWQGFGIKATAVLLTCFLATQMLGVPSIARAQDADEEAIATEVEDTKATTDASGAESTPEEEVSSATQEPEASESSTEDATEVVEGTETTDTTEGTESTTGTEDADTSGSADSVVTLSDDQGDEAGEQESADIELSAQSASAQLTSAKSARAGSALSSTFTGTATIENAEVAYVYYTGSDDYSSADWATVNNGDNIVIDCFATTGYDQDSGWGVDWHDRHEGYIVFFVKPADGFLVTGLGASGDGSLYSLDGALDKMDDFPGIGDLVREARSAGYVAAFGYSRQSGKLMNDDVTGDFEVEGSKPEVEVSATASPNENVTPGKHLWLNIVVTPGTETTDGYPLTVEGV